MHKANCFLVPVDEERSIVLASALGVALGHLELMTKGLEEFGVGQEELLGLCQEVNEKIHEHGWCRICQENGDCGMYNNKDIT